MSSKPKAPDTQLEVLSPWADVDRSRSVESPRALLRNVGPEFFKNSLVTKKIELPKNWDKLVTKYKDIKPNYEKY